jgi:transposase
VSTTGRKTEIIVGVERRRIFTPEQKVAIVEEAFSPSGSVGNAARKYGMHPAQIYTWRKCMTQGQLSAVEKEEAVFPESEKKALEKRIRELERVLGRKTLEVECLKEAVKIGREKKLISREPLQELEDFQ